MSFWSFIPKLLPALAQAGATIYGAQQASEANNKATQIMTDAQTSGNAVQVENRNAASPGLLATQEIIARGAKLNPMQETAVADTRAQALNALKGSSLRGSARATSAVVADADRRSRDTFMAQNQGRADTAAMNLTPQYFAAGNNVSKGLVDTGKVQADNAMGQGALRGQAIGDVGAIIANTVKESAKRERVYEPVGKEAKFYLPSGEAVY
jgi:hypothetical protein